MYQYQYLPMLSVEKKTTTRHFSEDILELLRIIPLDFIVIFKLYIRLWDTNTLPEPIRTDATS